MVSCKDSFYLFLPSDCDVKGIFIEENKRSNYKVPLPDPVDMGNDSWEVGLSEIFVPNYIHNIFPPFNVIELGWKTRYNETVDFRLPIPPGTYDAGQLASAINDSIAELNERLLKKKKVREMRAAKASSRGEGPPPKRTLREASSDEEGSESGEKGDGEEDAGEYWNFHGKVKYDEVTKKFAFLMRQREFFRFNYSRLRSIMGFKDFASLSSTIITPPPIPKKPQWMYLENPAYLNQYSQYLYVYCDVVSYSMVGNHSAPILRVVNVMHGRNDGKDVLHKSYEIPHYYKVARNQLKVINIQLCDGLGEKAEINAGDVICLLHFRKVPK